MSGNAIRGDQSDAGSVALFGTRMRGRAGEDRVDLRERGRLERLEEWSKPVHLLVWMMSLQPGPVRLRHLLQHAPLAFRREAAAEVALAELAARGEVVEIGKRPRSVEVPQEVGDAHAREAARKRSEFIDTTLARGCEPSPVQAAVYDLASSMVVELRRLVASANSPETSADTLRAFATRTARNDVRVLVRRDDPTRCFVCDRPVHIDVTRSSRPFRGARRIFVPAHAGRAIKKRHALRTAGLTGIRQATRQHAGLKQHYKDSNQEKRVCDEREATLDDLSCCAQPRSHHHALVYSLRGL